MSEDTLYEKLLTRAKSDPANAPELRQLARELNTAVDDAPMDREGARQMLSTWARVRRRWCEISGEPVVPGGVARTTTAILRLLKLRKQA